MAVKSKVDRKFSFLLLIITLTILTGLTLTFLSDQKVSKVSPSKLRGFIETSIDSDQQAPIAQIGNFEDQLNQTISVSEVPISLSELSGNLPNGTTDINANNDTLSPTLGLILENISTKTPFSETFVSETKVQTNFSSPQPTNQPSIVDNLFSLSLPLGTPQYLLIQMHQLFWRDNADSIKLSSINDDPIDRFHSALKYGEICHDNGLRQSKLRVNNKLETATNSLTDPSILPPIYNSILQYVLDHEISLFIEYNRKIKSQRPFSLFISAYYPLCQSILFYSSSKKSKPQDANGNYCGASRYPSVLNPPSNVLLVSPPTFENIATMGVLKCFQLIDSFENMMSAYDLIPYEYEVILGYSLCRCNITALPAVLPSNPFFSYWNSVDLLIEESMRNVAHICSIEINRTGTGARKYSKTEYYWVLRGEVTKVISLSAHSILNTGSLNLMSRFHLSAMLIPPFQNYSLSSSDTYLMIKDKSLTSKLYPTNLRGGSQLVNKYNPINSPNATNIDQRSNDAQGRQNITRMRRLSESSDLYSSEWIKRIFPLDQPTKATYWGELFETRRDEFDMWLTDNNRKHSRVKSTISDDDQ